MIYKGTDTVLKFSAKTTASPWIAYRSSVQHRRVGVAYLRFFGQIRVSFVAKLIFFLTIIIPAITCRCNFYIYLLWGSACLQAY